LGPRLFAAFIYGWHDVFYIHNYFFLIPIIGPIIGGILGVWIYKGFDWIVKTYGQIDDFQNDDDKVNDEKTYLHKK
jgi:hypothetical protein